MFLKFKCPSKAVKIRQSTLVPFTFTLTHQYTGICGPPWGEKELSLCSLSVLKPAVWFVSSLGLFEHTFAGSTKGSGGTHLVGHLVKGDGADTTSHTRNVPGSFNLDVSEKCSFYFSLFFLFFFQPKTCKVFSIVILVNILPAAL